MKFYVACIFICYLASVYGLFGLKLQEKLRATEDNCLQQTGDTLFSIDRVRRYKKLPKDGRLDKFAVCILKRYHIVNNDGTVNPDVKQYYLISDDGRKKQYAEDCRTSSTDGKGNNEIARNLLNCLLHTDIFFIDFAYRSQQVLSRLQKKTKEE